MQVGESDPRVLLLHSQLYQSQTGFSKIHPYSKESSSIVRLLFIFSSILSHLVLHIILIILSATRDYMPTICSLSSAAID